MMPAAAGSLVFVTEVAPYRRGGTGPTPAGVHHGLPSAVTGMAELAGVIGLPFHHLPRVEALDDAILASARILALFTIGETPWTDRQMETIERRWSAGELGIVGLHSATDASHLWPAHGTFLGARFNGHPVTTELPVAVLDPSSPATAHLPAVWRFRDELYLFRDLLPDARILLALRMGPSAAYAAGENLGVDDLPLAWCRQEGPARSFYTALGHFAAAWEDNTYLLHVLGGISWVLSGDECEADR